MMKKIVFLLALSVSLVGAFSLDDGWKWFEKSKKAFSKTSTQTKTKALKKALDISSNYAIAQLKGSGYLKKAKIPLPASLQKMSKVVIKLGGKRYVDELERDINLAAGEAIGKSKPIFKKAITSMSVKDASKLIGGKDDAITRYFEAKTSKGLSKMIKPIVKKATDKNKLSSSYATVLKMYNSSFWLKSAAKFLDKKPMSKDELDAYVARKAVEKSYIMIAKEEKKIRKHPFSYSSKLIRDVFGK